MLRSRRRAARQIHEELRASRHLRGVTARVVDRVLIVLRADGVEVAEDLRDHRAFDPTDDATLQRWYWMGDGVGVWWDDPDEGLEVRHMRVRKGSSELAAKALRDDVAMGAEQARRGETRKAGEVFARVRARRNEP